MSLLSPPPEPSNKYKALTFAVAALAIDLAIVLYFAFRYYPEKRAAEHFLDALVAGHEKQAYELWKPTQRKEPQSIFWTRSSPVTKSRLTNCGNLPRVTRSTISWPTGGRKVTTAR